VEALLVRLEKGGSKTQQALGAQAPEAWSAVVYREPHVWDVRDLLAHLLSAEQGLLRIAQDVAAGGSGAPESLDHDVFNAEEQQRLKGRSPQELLAALAAARSATLAWVGTLDDAQLERIGRHPGLGRVTLEAMLLSMHGHQLLHLRDVQHRNLLSGEG
jgi:hypothetical protein